VQEKKNEKVFNMPIDDLGKKKKVLRKIKKQEFMKWFKGDFTS